jgi:hypothetical protein
MDLPFDDEFVKILRGVEMASVKQKKKIAAGPRVSHGNFFTLVCRNCDDFCDADF